MLQGFAFGSETDDLTDLHRLVAPEVNAEVENLVFVIPGEFFRQIPVDMAVAMNRAPVTPVPFQDRIMAKDDPLSVFGDLVIAPDRGEKVSKRGVLKILQVVVSLDQMNRSVELRGPFSRYLGTETKVAETVNLIPGADDGIPVCDDDAVMMFDTVERALVVAEDVGVVEVEVGNQKRLG